MLTYRELFSETQKYYYVTSKGKAQDDGWFDGNTILRLRKEQQESLSQSAIQLANTFVLYHNQFCCLVLGLCSLRVPA